MQLLLPQKFKPKNPDQIELFHLSEISFKSCFLKDEMIEQLAQKLKVNRTLQKLNLSCNGLQCGIGIKIIQALHNNNTLMDLDISFNCLKNKFATELAKLLEENKVLHEVNISNNEV